LKRLVNGALSIYERVERMQEKDPEKIMGGEFALNPKSCLNIPSCTYSHKELKVRIMKSAGDK
jgi:hypothetical protein